MEHKGGWDKQQEENIVVSSKEVKRRESKKTD